MTMFVMVPGGWQGGWAFDSVVEQLHQAGHKTLAVTLTGLESNGSNRVSNPNLDTHIEDVITSINDAGDDEIVLCAHSYGGLPMAAAADRVPDRISALVYIDAYVPKDGDSCWKLTSDEFRQIFIAGAMRDGRSTDPPPGMDQRAQPHPMATLLQSVRITGAIERITNRHALRHTGWQGSPFDEQFERLKNDPSWTVHELDVAHNIMRVAPNRLSQLLIEIAATLPSEASK